MRKNQRELEFRDFFVAQSEPLRRFAIFLTGDTDVAADLAQESLARTYQHWGRIKDKDPAPYARRTLVNLVRSEHRRKLVRRKHDESHPGAVAPRSGEVDEWMRVSSALRSLSPIRRAVVVLRFYEDMTEADIARTLDRPIGTVKSDLHRALNALRPLLSEETGKRREEVR